MFGMFPNDNAYMPQVMTLGFTSKFDTKNFECTTLAFDAYACI